MNISLSALFLRHLLLPRLRLLQHSKLANGVKFMVEVRTRVRSRVTKLFNVEAMIAKGNVCVKCVSHKSENMSGRCAGDRVMLSDISCRQLTVKDRRPASDQQ